MGKRKYFADPPQPKITKAEYEEHRKHTEQSFAGAKLWASGTVLAIDRIENRWKSHCEQYDLDWLKAIIAYEPTEVVTFLKLYLRQKDTNVKTTATLDTYAHNLSQVHIRYAGSRVHPDALQKIHIAVQGTLSREEGLDQQEPIRALMTASDLICVIQCNWVTDNGVLPHERHRVQIATLLLAAAFTGSRPFALINVKYGDLGLFTLRHEGVHYLCLTIMLKVTKNELHRKRPKVYTFMLDDNPTLCLVSHFMALALADSAFATNSIDSPETVFELKPRLGTNALSIPWKPEILDTPIFRRWTTSGDKKIEDSQRLTYNGVNDYFQKLGLQAGFEEPMTSYCLRRGAGNAFNDHAQCNDSIRNLILDHSQGSKIFARNYLSRNIRFDARSAFLGTDCRNDVIIAAHQMSSTIDPDRPIRLTAEQRAAVRRESAIAAVCDERNTQRQEADRLKDLSLQKPYDTAIAQQLATAMQQWEYTCSRIKALLVARYRSRLREIVAEYKFNAPVEDIERQLSGKLQPTERPKTKQKYTFVERSRIAEALLSKSSASTRNQVVKDMAALCKRKDSVLVQRLIRQREAEDEDWEPEEGPIVVNKGRAEDFSNGSMTMAKRSISSDIYSGNIRCRLRIAHSHTKTVERNS
ncbi:MAG: hypothetical protein M1828_007009 [Chrysothrix sp. TS-e1954]|nr:MAG: hypothetical protein M1828_007009 [Chrysothrix sp. TS-e1954]